MRRAAPDAKTSPDGAKPARLRRARKLRTRSSGDMNLQLARRPVRRLSGRNGKGQSRPCVVLHWAGLRRTAGRTGAAGREDSPLQTSSVGNVIAGFSVVGMIFIHPTSIRCGHWETESTRGSAEIAAPATYGNPSGHQKTTTDKFP